MVISGSTRNHLIIAGVAALVIAIGGTFVPHFPKPFGAVLAAVGFIDLVLVLVVFRD